MTTPALTPSVPGAVSLSVIVVRFAGGDAISETLAALAPQVSAVAGEIVVAHRDDDAPSAALRSAFPTVRWLAGALDASPARLRSAGVRASVGAIVACPEDHCTPASDWSHCLLAAHARVHAIVGGAIDKAPTSSGAAWAAYLLDYARYMSPLPAGLSEHASDCNVSYRRRDLDDVAVSWEDEFHETTVQWALAACGVGVQLDPAIVVGQHRDVVLAQYLRERRAHGRIYANTRIAGASFAARARFATLALLLPPVIVLRVRRLIASRGAAGTVPGSAWGPLVRAALAWSAGELDGYVGRR
ncbi:MAG: hypothetical protein ABI910_14965 [Gemmatimonadota bacterium]